MRILLLSHYFSTHGGGVEIVAEQIAKRLESDGGVRITWLASDVDPVPSNLSTCCSPLPSWNPLEAGVGLPYPLLKPRSILALWREIGRSDVVHMHECQYLHSLIGAVFCTLHRKPYVVTQHVGEVEYRSFVKRMALGLLNRLGASVVLNRAKSVLFVSSHVMQFFASLMRGPNRAAVVQNGVDLDCFHRGNAGARSAARAALNIEPGRPVVAFAGRFVEKKGLHLIESLARARGNATFILAGQGPIDPNRWGLANVRVAGVLGAAQLASLYRAADLLCLPSFGEGFPLVVQEAMACGCPPLVDRAVARGGQLPENLVFVLDVRAPDASRQALALLDACLAESSVEREERRSCNAAFARAHWSWDRCADAHRAALRAALQ